MTFKTEGKGTTCKNLKNPLVQKFRHNYKTMQNFEPTHYLILLGTT